MPKYIPDKDFPKDRQNRMVPMKDGKIYSEIFPEGSVDAEKIRQSAPATCWLLGTLRSLAMNNPDLIRNLFTDNGDGTVTIHFNSIFVIAGDITIDKTLPPTDTECPDWVRLLEKGIAASEAYLGNGLNRSGINMDNLNWGRTDILLGMIDPAYTGDNPDITGILSESKDMDELISKFTDFCKHVMENQGAIMIQTSKHNMSVTKIENGIIYYFDQLTGKKSELTINSLFAKNSKIENLFFSLQGKGVISIAPIITPHQVLENMKVWHKQPTDEPSKKIQLEMVRKGVEHVLDTLAMNYAKPKNYNINMFGPNYDISAFVKNDEVIKGFFARSNSQNYADFHAKLRTTPFIRQYIANAYFDFLINNIANLPLEKCNLTKADALNTLMQWRQMNLENAIYAQKKIAYVEDSDFTHLNIYKTKAPYRETKSTAQKIREREEHNREIGKQLIQTKTYARDLDRLYHDAKSWSSSFHNSDQWMDFRHSLHIASDLAKVIDKMTASVKKKIHYQEGMDDALERNLENNFVPIGKLNSTVAGYINDYCQAHRIEEAKQGRVSYAHLCEILGASREEIQSNARRYVEYKQKKLELSAQAQALEQNNAVQGVVPNNNEVARNPLNKYDIHKLLIMRKVLPEEIQIPGYNLNEQKRAENPALNNNAPQKGHGKNGTQADVGMQRV